MTEKLIISINRKAIAALTLIFSGLLLIQGYWIKRVSVDRGEINKIINAATAPAAELLTQVRDMQYIQHYSLISVEQRLRSLEESYARVYEAVKEHSKHTAQIKPDIDSLNELLTALFLKKKDPVVPFAHPADTVKSESMDEHLIRRFRENQGRSGPYQ